MRRPAWEPTAGTVARRLVSGPSVWLMPRALAAAVKSWPARVAGGKPSAVTGGAGPGGLFAPAITTTATPETTMARMGIPTLGPQPRNSRPARDSPGQRRVARAGAARAAALGPSAGGS